MANNDLNPNPPDMPLAAGGGRERKPGILIHDNKYKKYKKLGKPGSMVTRQIICQICEEERSIRNLFGCDKEDEGNFIHFLGFLIFYNTERLMENELSHKKAKTIHGQGEGVTPHHSKGGK